MKKRLFATCALALLSSLAIALCLATFPFTANAETWGETGLQSEYAYGTQIEIPARKLTVGDRSLDAVSVLTAPDGDATLNTRVTLDTVGIYTVSYTAAEGGRTYRADETFEVYDTVARVGEFSYYSYGNYKDTDVKGLRVGLSQSESLEFSAIVDLRGAKSSEPIIECFAIPSTVGVLDYEQLNFTFTDAENPDCFLKVRGRQSLDGIASPNTYYLAGGENQPMSGWEGGNWNKLHVNDEWGAPAKHSFYGYYGDGSALEQVRISIRYDEETRCIYANDTFIIDLDSPQYFSKLWSGFTSGRVKVTVSADHYTATVAEFFVTHLKGVDLSQEKLIDDNAPEITVDTPYDVAPPAKVGTKYPVPEAAAKDDYSGIRPVKREIRYNFNSSNSVTVEEKDGCFIPDREGMYAIVYTACDRSGNQAKKIVWVEAFNDVTAPALVLTDKIEQVKVGEPVALADYSVTGGSGNADVTVEVTLEGTEIDCTNGFRPIKEGNYKVKYTARDHIGQTATAEYTVAATRSDKPIFIDAPVIPRYYISGSEYAVPELYAYDYTDGTEKKIKASVTVEDANGAPRTVEGAFTPLVVNNGESIKLTFTAGTAEPLVRTVKCIKPFIAADGRMKLQMQNYFVSYGATAMAGDGSVTVTADGSDNSYFEFANKLLAEGMSININALPEKSNFDGLKITITDSLDASRSLSVTLMKDNRVSYALMGDMRIDLTSGFNASSASNVFTISYLKNKVSLGTAAVDVTKYDGGEKFEGFASGYVYLDVSFVNATDGAAFDVTDISGQPISAAATDRIRPKIVLYGTFGDGAEINSEQIVPRAIAGDVLDPYTTLFLSVRDRAGNPVTAKDGTVLDNVVPDRDYVFLAGTYGQYSVSYVACDTFNGKDYTFGYVITVEDRIKPEVKFTTKIPEKVKVGETIVIPDFEASDNVSEKEKLTVNKYVCTPAGYVETIPADSNAFKPMSEGVYEIRIVVTDEAGNMTCEKISVTVTR